MYKYLSFLLTCLIAQCVELLGLVVPATIISGIVELTQSRIDLWRNVIGKRLKEILEIVSDGGCHSLGNVKRSTEHGQGSVYNTVKLASGELKQGKRTLNSSSKLSNSKGKYTVLVDSVWTVIGSGKSGVQMLVVDWRYYCLSYVEKIINWRVLSNAVGCRFVWGSVR